MHRKWKEESILGRKKNCEKGHGGWKESNITNTIVVNIPIDLKKYVLDTNTRFTKEGKEGREEGVAEGGKDDGMEGGKRLTNKWKERL